MRRRVGSLLLTIGLLVSAWPALAAEVVDVRVGKHPEFTRVVFELDRAAGYRIERSDSSRTAFELVVSLEAYASAERIRSSKSLIKQVDVEPAGSRSIARVSLSDSGLRLKEMILNNPPRIVIDILKPATGPATRSAKANSATSTAAKTAAAAASAKAAAESKAKAAKAAADAKAKEAKIAAAKAADAAAAKAAETAAAAKKKVKGSITVAKTSVAESAANAKNKLSKAGDNVGDAMANASKSAAKAASDSAETAAAAAGKLATNLADKTQNATDAVKNAGQDAGKAARDSVESLFGDDPQVAKAKPVQKPVTQKAAPRPKPMVAKSDSSEGGWLTWALAGAGVLALVGGGLFVARRRAGGEVDFADDYDEEDDDLDDADTQSEESNPFAGLADEVESQIDEASEQTAFGAPTAAAALIADDDTTTSVVSDADDEKESESVVFEDSMENDMDDMEVISREQVNESLGGTMPPTMGEVPAEFQQMMMEMSRRMEALESRCDELVDARDRLERQVAAQTEELRVQRAAIARTQRAVRNLGRADEDEHEPTEPALRDPNQPSSE